MARLAFDPAAHRYTLDGTELMSVTQALHGAGLIDDSWYTEYGRLRGERVHRALEWLDNGVLEEPTPDSPLRPYLDAYRDFMATSGATWEFVELRLHDATRYLAGTVDRVGYFDGKLCVLDLKTGVLEPWHRIQLAAYADLLKVAGLFGETPLIRRYGLYLTADGKYRLEQYADRQDGAIFQAALTVAQWRRAYGRPGASNR